MLSGMHEGKDPEGNQVEAETGRGLAKNESVVPESVHGAQQQICRAW